MNKNEAEEARKIIQGLIVSAKQNIDLTKTDNPDLRYKKTIIGHAHKF